MAILVTGGTGFIGSHTVVELLQSGYEVVIADNLYNSKAMVVDRIEKITGKRPTFYELDVCDKAALDALFDKEKIDAVIHFAGYKAVGESTRKPIEYYENNLGSTLTLCKSMREHGCFRIVFSSSATVYGDPAFIPITEECPKGITTNPYGETKSMQERIPRESRTICFPMWRRSLPASSRRFTYSETTMTRPTEPASATISTLWTWPRAMSRRSRVWRNWKASISSIWVRDTVIVFSTL